MNTDYLHICAVLDASGSMGILAKETKGSFNSFISSQSKTSGKTVFELWQFNTVIKQTVSPTDLARIPKDLMDHYQCGGGTAMNDAICIAIDNLGHRLAAMQESERPGNVMFVIITDGEENSSQKFSGEDVKKRIQCQRDVYSWDFIFLAANQDAFAAGADIGMNTEDCQSFEASEAGMVSNMKIMSCRAESIRNQRK